MASNWDNGESLLSSSGSLSRDSSHSCASSLPKATPEAIDLYLSTGDCLRFICLGPVGLPDVQDPIAYVKSWINPDFNPKKPFSLSSILHCCNTDRLRKRLEEHSKTMSRLSITGPDARVHFLGPPGTAKDGLASHILCVGAPDNLFRLPYRFYLLVLSDPSPL